MNLIPNTLLLIMAGLLASMASWAFILIIKDIYQELQELFMEIKSKRKIKKEECIIKKCREFLDQWMSDHIVIDGGNKIIWLYKDDTMTDDYISKVQDIIFDRPGKDWNVKVVYNWKKH